eukprot:1150630-Pelagomonas_calceolata.AAC.4
MPIAEHSLAGKCVWLPRVQGSPSVAHVPCYSTQISAWLPFPAEVNHYKIKNTVQPKRCCKRQIDKGQDLLKGWQMPRFKGCCLAWLVARPPWLQPVCLDGMCDQSGA